MQLKAIIVLLAVALASADLPNWDVVPNLDATVVTSTAGYSKAALRVPNGYCAGACSFTAFEPFCPTYGVIYAPTCGSMYNPLAFNRYPEISASDHDPGCASDLHPLTRDFILAGQPTDVSFGHYWCEQACLVIQGCIGFAVNPSYSPDTMTNGQCAFYFDTGVDLVDCMTGNAANGMWVSTPADPNDPSIIPWNTYFLTCPWKSAVGAPADPLTGCTWNSATNVMQCDSSFGGVSLTPSTAWAPASDIDCENLCKYNLNVGFPSGAQCNTWVWNNGVCTAYTGTATANAVGTSGSYGYNWLGCQGLSGQTSVPVATAVPPTPAPILADPPTPVPTTAAPFTLTPPTPVPSTLAPSTPAPSTLIPPTQAPSTLTPPTPAPTLSSPLLF